VLSSDDIARFERRHPLFRAPHPKPTAHSLARISAHFGVSLPPELVQLSRESAHAAGLFLSLGPDDDSPGHIIRTNSYWRRRRRTRKLPERLIIITHGFMDDDFHCLVRAENPLESNAMRVRYWSPAPVGHPKHSILGEPFENFAAYFDWLCGT